MRRLLSLCSLALLASVCSYHLAHAQQYPPPPGYYRPAPPPGYYPPPGPRGYAPPYAAENCGTPDEPKPCPPMPRVPLPYYPGNRS
jgi:hypothetical protein